MGLGLGRTASWTLPGAASRARAGTGSSCGAWMSVDESTVWAAHWPGQAMCVGVRSVSRAGAVQVHRATSEKCSGYLSSLGDAHASHGHGHGRRAANPAQGSTRRAAPPAEEASTHARTRSDPDVLEPVIAHVGRDRTCTLHARCLCPGPRAIHDCYVHSCRCNDESGVRAALLKQ